MAFNSSVTNEKGLHADPQSIHTDGQQTIASAEEFQVYLKNLKAHVESLLAIWKGAGADEFFNSYNEQDARLSAFQVKLDDFGTAITHAARILGAADEEAAVGAKGIIGK